jgi:dipeptidyl-peptidase-4
MIDDNVHPQNSTRLIRALQRADKDFEIMLYPEARHGIGGKHYNRLMYEFIMRTLGKPAAAPTEGSPEPRPAAERTGP